MKRKKLPKGLDEKSILEAIKILHDAPLPDDMEWYDPKDGMIYSKKGKRKANG